MASVREQSPISYAGKIKTPTLILANIGDYRVTITQSYKFFHALRDAGVATRFFAYPITRTTRGSRPAARRAGALDRLAREVSQRSAGSGGRGGGR